MRLLVLLFVSAFSLHGQTPNSVVGVWRFKDVHWIYAPKELGRHERTGNAGIMRFSPDGKFSLIYDAVIEQRGFPEVVSQGDAWTVYIGTWKQMADGIDVDYKLAYRDIHYTAPGRPGEGATLVKHLVRQGKWLLLDKVPFRSEPELAKSLDATFPVDRWFSQMHPDQVHTHGAPPR